MSLKRYFWLALVTVLCLAETIEASAQQKIGFVDSDYILSLTPEYVTVQQQLDRMAEEWNTELEDLGKQLDQQFRDYQTRELLYAQEERQRRRDEIIQAEEDIERKRARYFGPEGEIFSRQEQLMRPIQERILAAIEEVATEEGFDFIFDKEGEFLFLFARDQWNISDNVLEELGIDVTSAAGRQNRRR
ncbi:MAG: OmpH family outer membrane protein [Bacteroidetes bacterium]|nr:OmpH family outer membrane protein [Bacteroidota bacterium]